MQRKLAIILLAASTLTAASQNRFTEAARNATIKFEQTQTYKDMLYHIDQTLNAYKVQLSPKKYATATADHLIDNGFAVTEIRLYTATDSDIIIFYVPVKGTKNDEVKQSIKNVLDKWNPEN